MKVKFLTSMAGDDIAYSAGLVYDVDDEFGAKIADGERAVEMPADAAVTGGLDAQGYDADTDASVIDARRADDEKAKNDADQGEDTDADDADDAPKKRSRKKKSERATDPAADAAERADEDTDADED